MSSAARWSGLFALVALIVVAGGVMAAEPPAAKPPRPPKLSVRQRLQRAVDVSRALAARAQPSNDKAVRSLALEACEPSDRNTPLLFPRTEEVEAYAQARPCAARYAPNPAFLRPMLVKP